MNKTEIEWVRNPDGSAGFTWNPVVGCTYGCSYCFARRMAKRFKHRCLDCYRFFPHLHEERLGQPQKRRKPASVFVCDMGDLFDPNVDDETVKKVIADAEKSPQHFFFLLTKQAWRLCNFSFPQNSWLGVTCDGRGRDSARLTCLRDLKAADHRFVSFEPLLGPISELSLHKIDWVIIGAQTQPENRPDPAWVQRILDEAQRYSIPVFMKNNLRRPSRSQQFPSRG